MTSGDFMKTIVKFAKITYTRWKSCDKIILDGSIVFITNIPWYRSWFGLKPTRIIMGDGNTPCNKLRWI